METLLIVYLPWEQADTTFPSCVAPCGSAGTAQLKYLATEMRLVHNSVERSVLNQKSQSAECTIHNYPTAESCTSLLPIRNSIIRKAGLRPLIQRQSATALVLVDASLLSVPISPKPSSNFGTSLKRTFASSPF